jgi:hypothetical protein
VCCLNIGGSFGRLRRLSQHRLLGQSVVFALGNPGDSAASAPSAS